MGGRNVSAVLALYPKLSNAERLLLIHMASISLDPMPDGSPREDRKIPCLYYGSAELQALHMGYTGANADRLLRKLRSELVAAGAIVKVRAHAARRSPTWLIVTGEEPLITHHPEALLPWLAGAQSGP